MCKCERRRGGHTQPLVLSFSPSSLSFSLVLPRSPAFSLILSRSLSFSLLFLFPAGLPGVRRLLRALSDKPAAAQTRQRRTDRARTTTAAPPAHTCRARRHIQSRVASRDTVLLGAPSGPRPLPPPGGHTSHDATHGVTLHYTSPPSGRHPSPSPRPRESIRALLAPRPHHPAPAGPHTTHHTRCVRLLLLC